MDKVIELIVVVLLATISIFAGTVPDRDGNKYKTQ